MARTQFHDLVCKGGPATRKSGKAQKGGCTSSWKAPGAKCRMDHKDSQSATDDSDGGKPTGTTVLKLLTDASSFAGAESRGGKEKSSTYTQ